jgi:uncharacterized membrane protein
MRRLGWSGLAVVLPGLGLILAVALPLGPPWRTTAAVLFVLVVPGAAFVPLLGLKDTMMQLVLLVPVSFSVVILVAVALFYSGTWSADRQFVVLLVLCFLALAGRFLATSSKRDPIRSTGRRRLSDGEDDIRRREAEWSAT